MILSLQDLFSNGQTIGTATGDTASTNTLDWASHKDDLSRNLSIFGKVDGGHVRRRRHPRGEVPDQREQQRLD